MAVTCRDIMELEGCSKLKLVAGAGGIDREIRWPYIKNMDTISEWIHGGELVFVLGSWDDISEKGLLDLMKEAAVNQVAGVVILCGERYSRAIPQSTKRFANDNDIPMFNVAGRSYAHENAPIGVKKSADYIFSNKDLEKFFREDIRI